MQDAARYARVREIFFHVCDLDLGERRQRLEALCADDVEMRGEVERLLRSDDRSDASTCVNALARETRARLSAGMVATEGTVVGRYRIKRLIGRGGMGAVYEAEAPNPTRVVAIKLVHPGPVSPATLQRFEYEAKLLARLQHPGIARVHETGTADLGDGPRPWLAMELIDGATLIDHADATHATLTERLDLILRVCDATQHAHARGVIHRDLKPGNILVDASGQPKILDFGVARLIEDDTRAADVRTAHGELLGTVPYMSPEQATGDPDLVDTRSDVYAIGVLLFRLISGELPFDVEGRPLHEAVRIVREDTPRRLGQYGRPYRGDLETIVDTALARDRDRRYQSPMALADDIRRYLEDQPIVARPPSAIYQLRKFARRNRTLVGGMVATVVALAVGLAGTAYGLHEAEERGEALEKALTTAEQERGKEAAVSELFFSILTAARPRAESEEVSLKDFLMGASERAFEEEAEQPYAAARVHTLIGSAFLDLHEFDAAASHLDASLKLTGGEDFEHDKRRLDTATMRNMVAHLRAEEGPLEADLRARLRVQKAQFSPMDRTTVRTAIVLLNVLRLKQRDEEVLGIVRDYLAQPENLVQGDHFRLQYLRATALLALGRLEAADGAVDDLERLARPRLTNQQLAVPRLRARIASARRDFEQERRLLREVIRRLSEEMGPHSSSAMAHMEELAASYAREGNFCRKAEILSECRGRAEVVREALVLFRCDIGIARSLVAMGRYDEADRVLRRVDLGDRNAEARFDYHVVTSGIRNLLGDTVGARAALADASGALPLDRVSWPVRSQYRRVEAQILESEGHLDDAATLLIETLDTEPREGEPSLVDRALTLIQLARLLAELGDASLEHEAGRAADWLVAGLLPGHPVVIETQLAMAEVYLHGHDLERAHHQLFLARVNLLAAPCRYEPLARRAAALQATLAEKKTPGQ